MITDKILSSVKKISNRRVNEIFIPGGRGGTCTATEDDLINLFGLPAKVDDDKVTKKWLFLTPKGMAEVRDYWWNASNEWSIAGDGKMAVIWLIGYLNRKGLIANRKIGQTKIRG